MRIKKESQERGQAYLFAFGSLCHNFRLPFPTGNKKRHPELLGAFYILYLYYGLFMRLLGVLHMR